MDKNSTQGSTSTISIARRLKFGNELDPNPTNLSTKSIDLLPTSFHPNESSTSPPPQFKWKIDEKMSPEKYHDIEKQIVYNSGRLSTLKVNLKHLMSKEALCARLFALVDPTANTSSLYDAWIPSREFIDDQVSQYQQMKQGRSRLKKNNLELTKALSQAIQKMILNQSTWQYTTSKLNESPPISTAPFHPDPSVQHEQQQQVEVENGLMNAALERVQIRLNEWHEVNQRIQVLSGYELIHLNESSAHLRWQGFSSGQAMQDEIEQYSMLLKWDPLDAKEKIKVEFNPSFTGSSSSFPMDDILTASNSAFSKRTDRLSFLCRELTHRVLAISMRRQKLSQLASTWPNGRGIQFQWDPHQIHIEIRLLIEKSNLDNSLDPNGMEVKIRVPFEGQLEASRCIQVRWVPRIDKRDITVSTSPFERTLLATRGLIPLLNHLDRWWDTVEHQDPFMENKRPLGILPYCQENITHLVR